MSPQPRPTVAYRSSVKPFVGNQKQVYMTGYVGKTLQNMDQEPGTSPMMAKGDEFTDQYTKDCVASYMQSCPQDPNAKKTAFTKNNVMLYALNFANRFLPHLHPRPSFGRTLAIMVKTGKYIPASNYLATGYPLDRYRAEKLWRILSNPDECTKEELCEMIFTNNEAMLIPVMDVLVGEQSAACSTASCRWLGSSGSSLLKR